MRAAGGDLRFAGAASAQREMREAIGRARVDVLEPAARLPPAGTLPAARACGRDPTEHEPSAGERRAERISRRRQRVAEVALRGRGAAPQRPCEAVAPAARARD